MVNKHFTDRGFLQSSGWDNNFMSAKLPSDFSSHSTIKVKLLTVTGKTRTQFSGLTKVKHPFSGYCARSGGA